MTTFDDRERAFEAKFAHDAEMHFKAEARRNHLLGLWAAGLLGKSGDEAEAYAQEVMRADLAQAGEEDVLRKLREDLRDHVEEAQLRERMHGFLAEAKAQIMTEAG